MTAERVAMIKERLNAALSIEELDVIDDSHKHAGHAGAAAGGGHFRARVVSPDFAGKSTMERHRMIYAAMGDAMRNDVIHALSIKAYTPEEFRAL
ncbi:BolA family transcriptional regulator [Alkalilimnicola ehrlichii]|uniref:BolA family transcriptional regulator n=1 Tax=Alkalilimnicola ehrlichii TaxID=351052 RepID=A0A3E0WY58_9GAMM|nr:BolA family protein [Alkalilimnicola ehrlichii]RFA27741.1 BolA family transcriptional regulator [Alkalilimnicola ehrlichii]RFA36925.1 BolA family transcriptional regulator [Alkalilimnicola ehrlichii]